MGIIAFIILETVTYQLVSIWFAIGALGGMIAAFSGVNFYVQMAVFIAVSFICILCLRPISMKFFKPRNVETNAQSLVGKEVLITSDVDNIRGLGEGKVDGKVWTVRSIDNSHVLKGETAVIEKIEGVKLMLKRKDDLKPLAIILLLIIILVIIVANIKIVPQAHSYIIERLGGYYATWGVGLHFKVPFIDRIAKKVNLKNTLLTFRRTCYNKG